MAANPSIQLGTDGNWAIKEDNLLAYKKDGTRFFNKEFDFTRGSLATFVDKDGLIKVSGVTDTELVVNGDFATSLSGWSNSNNHWQWTSQGAYFPLISTHNPLTQILTNPVGVKLKITFTLNIVQGTAQIYYNNINNSTVSTQYTQSGTYTLITEPVKQNTDISFSRYGGINTEFYLNNVSAFEIQLDVPRIDFTDDATGHLLLEPQRTNIIAFSEGMFDSSHFNKINGVIADGQQTDLNGTNTAVKLSNFVQGSARLDYNSTVAAVDGKTYTYSAYYKGSGDIRINVSTSTGIGGSGEKTINLTDEWVRHSITATFSNPTGNVKSHLAITRTPNNDAEVYLCFAQIEEGSYATSYIPTYGSTATRNGEACNNSGSVQDFNSEEGVLYAEISALADNLTNRFISLTDGTDDNSVCIFYGGGSSNFIRSEIKSNNITQAELTTTSYSIINFNKIAVKYKENDFALWVNGVKVSTDTSGFTPIGLNNLSFDRENILTFYGNVKRVAVFKRALSNGELYLLTVTQYQSYQEMATALNYTL